MTRRDSHRHNDPLGDEEWLAHCHATAGADLAAHLDVAAGLQEVLITSRHRATLRAVADSADVEAGRRAILPDIAASRPGRELPASAESPLAIWSYAQAVARLPLSARLALRGHLPLVELTQARVIAQRSVQAHEISRLVAPALDDAHALDLTRACALAHDFARDLDCDLDGILVLDRYRDRGVVRALDFAAERAGDLIRLIRALDLELVRDLALIPDHALDHAFDLARSHARALDDACGRALAHVLDRIRSRDCDCRRARGLIRALDHKLLLDLALKRELALVLTHALEVLDSAMADFTGVDLTDIDLHGLELVGLRWSNDTRWPAGWDQWAAQVSVPIGEGVWEVRDTPHSDLESEVTSV